MKTIYKSGFGGSKTKVIPTDKIMKTEIFNQQGKKVKNATVTIYTIITEIKWFAKISSIYEGEKKIIELNEEETEKLISDELKEISEDKHVYIENKFANMLIRGKKRKFELKKQKKINL